EAEADADHADVGDFRRHARLAHEVVLRLDDAVARATVDFELARAELLDAARDRLGDRAADRRGGGCARLRRRRRRLGGEELRAAQLAPVGAREAHAVPRDEGDAPAADLVAASGERRLRAAGG